MRLHRHCLHRSYTRKIRRTYVLYTISIPQVSFTMPKLTRFLAERRAMQFEMAEPSSRQIGRAGLERDPEF